MYESLECLDNVSHGSDNISRGSDSTVVEIYLPPVPERRQSGDILEVEPSRQVFDCFLLHGYDLPPALLENFCAALHKTGLGNVCYDCAEAPPRSITRQMIQVDNSRSVVMLLTAELVGQLQNIDETASMRQFIYAALRKPNQHFFAVVMGNYFPTQSSWTGLLGQALGGHTLFYAPSDLARALLDSLHLTPALHHGHGSAANMLLASLSAVEKVKEGQFRRASLSPQTSTRGIDQGGPTETHRGYREFLHRVPLLEKCSEAEFQELAEQLQEQHFADDEVVLRQGDVGDTFYIIKEGTAIVRVAAKMIKTLGPGNYFGEMALIENKPRFGTVTAKGALTVLALDRDTFNHILIDTIEARVLRKRVDALRRLLAERQSNPAMSMANPNDADTDPERLLSAGREGSQPTPPQALERWVLPGGPLSMDLGEATVGGAGLLLRTAWEGSSGLPGRPPLRLPAGTRIVRVDWRLVEVMPHARALQVLTASPTRAISAFVPRGEQTTFLLEFSPAAYENAAEAGWEQEVANESALLPAVGIFAP